MRALVVCLIVDGCYSGGDGDGADDDIVAADANGDGAPDDIGPDPELGNQNSRPGDYDGDGLADDLDVDDDNDGILDDAPDVALIDALRPIARAECGAVAACCTGGWSARALGGCELETTGALILSLAQGWTEGLFSVDTTGLGDCLDQQLIDCVAPDGRNAPNACDAYLLGEESAHQPCYQSADCSGTLACAGFAGASFELSLGPGPYFSRWFVGGLQGAGECVERLEEGASCVATSGDDPPCADGLTCIGGDSACHRLGVLGESCTIEGQVDRRDDCYPALFCDDTTGEPSCITRRPNGGPCIEDRECASATCDARRGQCEDGPPRFDACREATRYDATE